MLPQDALDAMLKMSDDLLSNKLSESHGQSLAGVIDKEIKVYKSDMDKAVLINFLSRVFQVMFYIVRNNMDFLKKHHIFESMQSTLHGLCLNMKMSTIQHIITLVVI